MEEALSMAKALIGYLDRTRHTSTGLASENARLRARVGDLEALVVRLAEENDRLLAREAPRPVDAALLARMQPA
jgi:hypothetical protein